MSILLAYRTPLTNNPRDGLRSAGTHESRPGAAFESPVISSGLGGLGRLLGFDRTTFTFDVTLTTFPFFHFVILSAHKSLYIRSAFRFCSHTMIIGHCRFNIYLCCLLALLCGCRSTKDDKDKRFSTLRVHLEAMADSTDFTMTVPIYREKPIQIHVDKSPFATEANVTEARVIDDMGGFALQVQLNHRGTALLELNSTTNPGKHLAIFSEFGPKTNRQTRWLAAPIMARRVSNGLLTFTPDATRDEAEEVALGLNNLAKKIQEKSKW